MSQHDYRPTTFDLEVVTGLANGSTLRAISRQRGLSEGGMQLKMKHLRANVDATTNMELVAIFLRQGWIV